MREGPSPRDLPGGDLVAQGLDDLDRGVESIAALLVSIGAPRLRRLMPDRTIDGIDSPEHRLYLNLRSRDPSTAHSRYNALVRRLVSYERAAECVL